VTQSGQGEVPTGSPTPPIDTGKLTRLVVRGQCSFLGDLRLSVRELLNQRYVTLHEILEWRHCPQIGLHGAVLFSGIALDVAHGEPRQTAM
jgi:hypothetical protein